MPKETEIDLKPGNVQPTQDQSKEKQPTVEAGNLIKEAKEVSAAELVDLVIAKRQDEILPWETCILPSRGLYYDGRIPEGKVEVRPLGLTAEKIMATSRLTQSGQALDHVYKNHVRFPDAGFDPLELLSGDRTFLLFYLRGITHGNIYEFSVKCDNDACGSQSLHEYDLNLLQETFRPPTHAKEPVRIKLPHISKTLGREVWVDARFIRGSDLQAIARRRRFDEKITAQTVRSAKSGKEMSASTRASYDKSIEENLNLIIVSVLGQQDRHKIAEFLKRLPSSDLSLIRRKMNDEAPGMDIEILVTCPDCENEMRMELPITESFFRPQNNGGM